MTLKDTEMKVDNTTWKSPEKVLPFIRENQTLLKELIKGTI